MQLLWFIPTHGDGRYLGTATGGRAVTFPYLRQIAQAAKVMGSEELEKKFTAALEMVRRDLVAAQSLYL